MLIADDVRFDAYSLFCRYMVDRLDSLRQACSDRKLTVSSCIKQFDGSLEVLFKNSIDDRSLALDLVALNLQTLVGNLQISNRDAAKLIAEAREEALDNKDSWSYSTAVELCHQQGRDLAILFFKNSKSPATQKRLDLRATLNYVSERTRAARVIAQLKEDLPESPMRNELLELEWTNHLREVKQKYEGLPGALYTFEGRRSGDYSINVPLSPRNGVMLYASYPFLFMHEYTAHIFSNDYLNDRFNDGWMLYAASQYLVKNWAREPADPRLSVLNGSQTYAFKRYLAGTLLGESVEHHNSAEDIHDFLGLWDPNRFESMTYELAAYEPQGMESDKWPTDVLKALARDMGDRVKLRERMQKATTLAALYPDLKLKPPDIRSV